MAKTYQMNAMNRFVNRVMMQLTRLGIGPKNYAILTVTGRKSGKLYSTPISLVIHDGQRYMVAPYGDVSWVKNARAAGEVTLQRGKVTETLGFTELEPADAGPILQIYYGHEAITRPYFDVPDNPTLDDFVQDAPNHPVFLLDEAQHA